MGMETGIQPGQLEPLVYNELSSDGRGGREEGGGL